MDDLLMRVDRPSRYLGGEVGEVRKDPARVDVRLCLAFPDVYEIGMSHQGTQILYHALNAMPWIYAERFFLPWTDAILRLRQSGRPPTSLETGTPLARFDVLGITLQTELSYTNVLAILDLAGLPLRSADRAAPFPLVLGGGPCAANPEPVAPFFDAILVGDGEEAAPEICGVVRDAKRDGATKESLLAALARVEGVYVPSLADRAGGKKIRRRVVNDLEHAPYPAAPVVPFTETVHDRLAIEIARGCTRGCRFCQAGFYYRPVRERSPDRLLALLERSLAATGYGDVSLLSLSSGDYTCIEPLVAEVVRRLESKNVALSLPSLRVESVSGNLVESIRRVRKTGFTIAPEAGAEALRFRLNKRIADEEILQTARTIYRAGWDLLKLYFMIGLPFETEDDVEAIARLAVRVRGTSGGGRRPGRLHINVATFVPKAHTPFQWVAQLPIEEAARRLACVRGALADGRIQVKFQRPEMSFVEGFLARGDRRAADVVEGVFRAGGVFDGWNESFDLARWERAADAAGVDLAAAVTCERTPGGPLPWDVIDLRVDPAFLREEWERARRDEPTPDCRREGCQGCGVCGDAVLMHLAVEGPRPTKVPSPAAPGTERFLYRLRYPKRGPATALGHHELAHLFARALRRAEIPIAYSEGFHPAPRILFGPPLGQGIESDGEYVDLVLTAMMEPAELMRRLREALPLGLGPDEVHAFPRRTPSICESIIAMRYHAAAPDGADWLAILDRTAEFNKRGNVPVTIARKGREKSLDLKTYLTELRPAREGVLSLSIAFRPEGSLRPREALALALGLATDEAERWRLTKVETEFRG